MKSSVDNLIQAVYHYFVQYDKEPLYKYKRGALYKVEPFLRYNTKKLFLCRLAKL